MTNVTLDLRSTQKILWCPCCNDYTEHKRDGKNWICLQHSETKQNPEGDEKCQDEL